MMSTEPSPKRDNGDGRSSDGRFAIGWKGGPGNPNAKRTAEFRRVILATVTFEDIQAIVAKLILLAKAGDIQAAREILDRVCGKPGPMLADGDNPAMAAIEIVNALKLLATGGYTDGE